jgi:hypothetical protein
MMRQRVPVRAAAPALIAYFMARSVAVVSAHLLPHSRR